MRQAQARLRLADDPELVRAWLRVSWGVAPAPELTRRAGSARIALLAAATAAALPAALSVPFEAGSDAWIDPSGPASARARLVEERFGAFDDLVVARYSPDVLRESELAWERELAAEVESWPERLEVEALTRAEDAVVDELGVSAAPLLDRLGQPAGRDAVLHHPLYAGALVARDGRAAALLLRPPGGLGPEAMQGLVSRLRERLHRSPPPAPARALLAGLPVQKLEVAAVVQADQRRTVPLAGLLLAALLLGLLRGGPLLLAGLGATVSAAVWSRALLALTGTPVDALLGLLPPLAMAVAVSTSLHLVVPAARARRAGGALAPALRAVALPVALTLLTTVAGLSGLLLGAVPAVRRFGLFGSAGVLLAGASACAWLWAVAPRITPEAGERALGGGLWQWLERLAGRLLDTGISRPGAVALAAAVAVVGAGSLLPRIRVDANFLAALPETSALRRAEREIDARLTGTLPVEVLVDIGREPGADDLAALSRAVATLRAQPGIRHAVSLADLLALVDRRALEAGLSAPEAGQTLADLRDLDPARYARWVGRGFDSDALTVLRVSARQRGGWIAEATSFEAPLRRALARELPGARVVVAGGADILAETTARVVPAVLRGVLLTLPVVGLLIAVSLGSPWLALTAVPAVALPLLAVYALLPLLDWPLDVGLSMIACVSLGIVVDDTVHVVAALRRPDPGRAVRALAPVLVATSLSLGVAFLACLAGRFAHTRHFGLLLALAFGVALLVNLVGLPALLRRRLAPH